MPRPRLPLKTVVEQFNVSRSTLNRGIKAGRFPDAAQDPAGHWTIPVDQVLAAGYTARQTWLINPTNDIGHQGDHDIGHDTHRPRSTPSDPSNSLVTADHSQLENDLAHERSQVQLLTALLDAERDHVQTLKRAMAMIEASHPVPTSAPEKAPAELPRKRWWARR